MVLNNTDYVSECTWQISDTFYYERLDSDPTDRYNKIIFDGKDYSGAKFFYTEPISLNKAHLTK